MTNAQCKDTNWSPSMITDNMICAADTGKSSCYGDSGGPLVANEGSHYSVIGNKAIINLVQLIVCFFLGVVSWGPSLCTEPGFPGVYARVTSQLSWINDHISGTICPKP